MKHELLSYVINEQKFTTKSLCQIQIIDWCIVMLLKEAESVVLKIFMMEFIFDHAYQNGNINDSLSFTIRKHLWGNSFWSV